MTHLAGMGTLETYPHDDLESRRHGLIAIDAWRIRARCATTQERPSHRRELVALLGEPGDACEEAIGPVRLGVHFAH